MPTILFDDNFDKFERTILTKTYRANCRDLGISNTDATIETRRMNMGAPRMFPDGPREVGGGLCQVAKDFYIMAMNTHNFLMPKAIYTVGHELVHFHQCVRGDLRQYNGGSIWRGKFYSREMHEDPNLYMSLPWEIEAHGKQDDLFNNAMRSLSPFERMMVMDSIKDLRRAA